MQSPKAINSSLSPLVALTLKATGVVITLSAIVDILVLSLPTQASEQPLGFLADRVWQLAFVTNAVDRGIVPMVGIVLFLVGVWIEGNAEGRPQRALWQDARFWALVLSSILGAAFLLMFPLHLYNVNQDYQATAAQITEEASSTEGQIDTQVDAEIESFRQQINLLVAATDEQIAEFIENGQLQQEQADLIRQFKQNPSSIEPYLEERRQELAEQYQTQLGIGREEAQQGLTTEAVKSGLRIGISSLLLSIGFIVIGWTGLRSLRQGL